MLKKYEKFIEFYNQTKNKSFSKESPLLNLFFLKSNGILTIFPFIQKTF